MNFIKKVRKRVRVLLWQALNRHKFRKIGKNCFIQSPIAITPNCIELHDSVIIRHHARIQGVSKYLTKSFTPTIILKDGVSIQQGAHITCANLIEIGENTAIAGYVTITDIHHPYDDITKPIEKQDILVKEVIIGPNCKFYNNAVVLPGVHIGRHVTVAANCVVNKDIPDYSVVAGIPCRILKRFNFETNLWEKTNPDGSFI